jgi:hypothetical protein
MKLKGFICLVISSLFVISVSSCLKRSDTVEMKEGELLVVPSRGMCQTELVHLVQQQAISKSGITVYYNCINQITYITNSTQRAKHIVWNDIKYAIPSDQNPVNPTLALNTKKLAGKPVLLID